MIKKDYKLCVIDLFCGCGGLSLGINKSGNAKVIYSFDNCQEAIDCYKENVSINVDNVDLSNPQQVIDKINKLNPDMIAGGSPCQEFSVAGLQQEGDKADLTRSFAEIIRATKPQWFFLENVPQIQKSNAYSDTRKLFKLCNYGLTEVVVNAFFYGVPQSRKRFICIGRLGEKDNFMKQDILAAAHENPLTIREYYKKKKWKLEYEYYYTHPRSYKRRGIFSVDYPSPTIRAQNRPFPSNYKKHSLDAVYTGNISALTHIQRAKLQTFPLNFKFSDTRKTVLETMIGNAIPVELAKNLFRYITTYSKLQPSKAGRKPKYRDIWGINRDVYIRWLINVKNYEIEQAKDMWSLLSRAWKEGLKDESELLPTLNKKSADKIIHKFITPLKLRSEQKSRMKTSIHLLYTLHRKLIK